MSTPSSSLGSGLVNLGNTCFFNATLQCLLHSPSFSLQLSSKRHSSHCHLTQWCVYCELQSTYQKTKNNKVVQPQKLVYNLKKLFKKLGRQEDSHEFLRYFVEGVQKADIGNKEKDPVKVRQITERSKVFELFGGLMKSSVECEQCHHKSEIVEHFYDLSLQCQRSNSVQQSFSNYFRIDYLHGNNKYHCSNCKKLVNANKRFLFHRLPAVLTIQLKRFTNSLHKLNKFVQFPETLQLQKYTDTKEEVGYRLGGVVVHAGSTSFSGHYYSYNKVGNSWYKMDDSYVTKVEKETVMGQKAYLLFYERVGGGGERKEREEIKEVESRGKKEEVMKGKEDVLKFKEKMESKEKEKIKDDRFKNKPNFFQQISEAINQRKDKSIEKPKPNSSAFNSTQPSPNLSQFKQPKPIIIIPTPAAKIPNKIKQASEKEQSQRQSSKSASNKNIKKDNQHKKKSMIPKQDELKPLEILPRSSSNISNLSNLSNQSKSSNGSRRKRRYKDSSLELLRNLNSRYYWKKLIREIVDKGTTIGQ